MSYLKNVYLHDDFFLLSFFFGYMQWHNVFDNVKFHIKFFMDYVNFFYMFTLLHVFYYLYFVMMQMKLKQNVWEKNHLEFFLGLFIIDQFSFVWIIYFFIFLIILVNLNKSHILWKIWCFATRFTTRFSLQFWIVILIYNSMYFI
jgi:hypothetical protein